jgi:hypothetical protein
MLRIICITTGLSALMALGVPASAMAQEPGAELTLLPAPRDASASSVEQALTERRSTREFAQQSVTLEEMGQLLWAAQGVTRPQAERPSHWPPEWQWMGVRAAGARIGTGRRR